MRHLTVYCELDMEASVSTLRTVYTVLAHLCRSLGSLYYRHLGIYFQFNLVS